MDVAEEPLEAARTRHAECVAKGVKRGRPKPEMVEPILTGIVHSTDYDSLPGKDLVIEAATEDVAFRKRIGCSSTSIG